MGNGWAITNDAGEDLGWARERADADRACVIAREQGEPTARVVAAPCDAELFGRIDDNGNVRVYHHASGEVATRLDAHVYPVGSAVSARYEHPRGIVLTPADAARLAIRGDGVVS